MNRRKFLTGVAAVVVAGPSIAKANAPERWLPIEIDIYSTVEEIRELIETAMNAISKSSHVPRRLLMSDYQFNQMVEERSRKELLEWHSNLKALYGKEHAGQTSREAPCYQHGRSLQEHEGGHHDWVQQRIPSKRGVLRGLQSRERQSGGGDGYVRSPIEALPARRYSGGHLEIDVRTSVSHRDDMPSNL